MPENTQQPMWEEQPDGSRVKMTNGIRIIDRTVRTERPKREIEHLVAHEEEGGLVVILGLDAACRPVYQATL